jgi:hypothetical protein
MATFKRPARVLSDRTGVDVDGVEAVGGGTGGGWSNEASLFATLRQTATVCSVQPEQAQIAIHAHT